MLKLRIIQKLENRLHEKNALQLELDSVHVLQDTVITSLKKMSCCSYEVRMKIKSLKMTHAINLLTF